VQAQEHSSGITGQEAQQRKFLKLK